MNRLMWKCIELSFDIALISGNMLFFLSGDDNFRYFSLLAVIIGFGLLWWTVYDINKIGDALHAVSEPEVKE